MICIESTRKEKIQEVQYEFPYHYIPIWSEQQFSQNLYWSWGFRYLGGMQIVFDQLEKLSFDSLIDIGCGDGRFLREISQRYPLAQLLGVDSSAKAIRLARALNPNLNYRVMNIIKESLNEHFDIATLIEVLEHIPLNQIEFFLNSTADILNDDGWLMLTVPHANKQIQYKHYMHFTSNELRKLLSENFRNFTFIPFDVKTIVMSILSKVLGGNGNYFLLTNRFVLSWFFKLYKNKYLYSKDEKKCLRIGLVCQKK